MCTTNSLKNWESRRRQWKMHKGTDYALEAKLQDLDLWWRKDSKGHLELVDRRLRPYLDGK